MEYEETTLLPVSFAPLIVPGKDDKMKSIDIGKNEKNNQTFVLLLGEHATCGMVYTC